MFPNQSIDNKNLDQILRRGSNLIQDYTVTHVETIATAPSVALAGAGAGNVDNGAHTYAVTFVTSAGETIAGATATVTVTDKTANGKIAVSSIPIGSPFVTARKVYRSSAGTTTPLKLLVTISDNSTTAYTDNTADSGLTTTSPSGDTTANAIELFTKNGLQIATGTATVPSLAFAAETTLGLYRSAAGFLGVSGYLDVKMGLKIGGGYTPTLSGDTSLARNGGASGFLYFGNTGNVFLGWDGSKFAFTNAGDIDGNGLMNLGSSTNAGQLNLYAADNTAGACNIRINATQANITAADVFANFNSTSGTEGSIAGTAVAGVIAYNTFTGSHYAQSNTITATSEFISGTKEVPKTDGDREWTEKIDFKYTKYFSDIEPGAVLVSTEELSLWPGEVCNTLPKVALSTKPQDKAVYGVYGGHDQDGDIQVLALGSCIICVTDEGGVVEIGDFLCSSSTPGRAMKYDGSDMRVVIAKARQGFSGTTGKIACSLIAG